jgi:hypothetical protein
VHSGSPADVKVAFFGALFAARTDIYAVRWDNARTGQKGWLPTVRGGWRKGLRHAERDYLPLTAEVLAAHLTGEMHIGLYPLLDGDRCWWLVADFDGPAAMLDALDYVKAARALSVPVGLEASRPGTGAHAWIFFTAPVPAEAARRLGTGLVREAMSLRGRMSLASYDRLFPSQDNCGQSPEDGHHRPGPGAHHPGLVSLCRLPARVRDRQLGLRASGTLSRGLAEMSALAGAEVSFTRAAALMAGLAGVTLSPPDHRAVRRGRRRGPRR